MRARLIAVTALLLLFAIANLGAQGTPAPTPEENPTGNSGALKSQIQTGGSYDAHSGNATRVVNDLHVPGALGGYGLDFTRYWNSTHNDYDDPNAEWPLDFGMSGWSHSWHWRAEYVAYTEQAVDGGETLFFTAIIITFPDGHTTKFKIVRSDRAHGTPPNVAPPDPRLGPPYTDPEINSGFPRGGMGVHDHLCKMDPNGTDFWLCRADGGAVHFTGGSGNYYATEVYDPHGDVLGAHAPVLPGDLGAHVLIGDEEDLGRHSVALGRAVVRMLFRRPGVLRIVGEPDVRNENFLSLLAFLGFRKHSEVDLPDKRAAFMVCERADFERLASRRRRVTR